MSDHARREPEPAAGAGEVEVVVGDPSDEELAAIVAAVETTWPRAAAAAAPDDPPRWRFSGRWWSKPVPMRRSRPW